MLTVEKIGGTSMSRFQDVLKNVIIGDRKENELYNRIFVVSAYNNVTNWLLEHKKTKEPGIYERFIKGDDYISALDTLCDRLILINEDFADIQLDLKEASDFLRFRIGQAKTLLSSINKVMSSGYVNKTDLMLAAREILASIGEAHSAWNTVNILNNHGINARFVDLCGFNDNEELTIDQRIHKEFSNIDFSEILCIATGYTKGMEGIMRAFDRGYSEITFSKIAVEVKASEAIIHKEYHLSNADPKIVGVDRAVPVCQTNFVVADQLANIGMEAIHPKASKPLELANINIRIKNTFDPKHQGTLITRNYISKIPCVEIISGSNRLIAIEVHDPMIVDEAGADFRITQVFNNNNVSYIIKSTNANVITCIIWENQLNETFLSELHKRFFEVNVVQVAMVCVIGTNIAHPGFLFRSSKALYEADINVLGIAQSLKQVNIQFIIERDRYDDAIIALFDEFLNG